MNIKRFLLSTIIVSAFSSCVGQKNSVMHHVDALGRDQTIEDSVIRRLRESNDIIIAYAIENFAWARSISYLIIAKKNDEWMGYRYYVNLMPNQPRESAPGNINPAEVNNVVCDSLLQYITKTSAWNIKGDADRNFCPDANQNCNINDAEGARLWIITKKGLVNPSYYAPEFFEQC